MSPTVIAFGTKTPALLIESAAKQKAGRARTTISSHQESDTNCLMPILGAVSVPDWSGKSSERPIVKSAYMERMRPGSINRSGHASGRAINNGNKKRAPTDDERLLKFNETGASIPVIANVLGRICSGVRNRLAALNNHIDPAYRQRADGEDG
jgi:hypothetical protein